MTWKRFNDICVVIFWVYLEKYIGKLDVDKTRLRDSIRVHRQHKTQP